jgi:hypothetical protein
MDKACGEREAHGIAQTRPRISVLIDVLPIAVAVGSHPLEGAG